MDAHNLWLFFVLILGTVLLPGLDMTYILARSLAGGVRDGALAMAGILAGTLVHVVIGVLGLATLLLAAPWAFNALLCIGAAYIAWIGWTLVRHAGAVGPFQVEAATTRATPVRLVLMGMATSLSNPKAYLFMLAVFPQFVDPARGSLWPQAAVLWLISFACQVVIYGALAVAAARARHWFQSQPHAAQWIFRIVGVLLIVFAVFTVIKGLRGLA